MSPNPPLGYPRISPYLNCEDAGAKVERLARARAALILDLPPDWR